MRRFAPLLALVLLFVPIALYAQAANTNANSGTFSRNGIFGCSPNGAYAMSVGSMSAVGGVYVPVSDAAVTLNTGTLVYKECILREVIDAERMKATADILRTQTQSIQTGRGGSAQYVQKPAAELQNIRNETVTKLVQAGYLNGVNDAIRSDVSNAVVQSYVNSVKNPTDAFSCDYSDLQNALAGNPQSVNDALSHLIVPGCDAMSAYNISSSQLASAANTMASLQLDQWNWNRGLYSKQQDPTDPFSPIVTPGVFIEGGYQTVYNSSFNQLQNADDIGQIVGDTFARFSTMALASSGGLAGLLQSPGGGQPSYLDQIATETGDNVANSAIFTAAQNLSGAIQAEQLYMNALQTIAAAIAKAIDNPQDPGHSLRGMERACWTQVIQKVCANGEVSADGTCTAASSVSSNTISCSAQGVDSNGLPNANCKTAGTNTIGTSAGTKLKVATSSYPFAQAFIDSQIRATASTTIQEIETSSTTLATLKSLAAAITSASNKADQLKAIQQTEDFLANNPIKSQTQIQSIQSAVLQIESTMAKDVEIARGNWVGNPGGNITNSNQYLAWDGSVYPGVGWCSVDNQSTIDSWTTKWTQ